MAVRLNKAAYEHARSLVKQGKAVVDDRDAWSEHRPSAADENRYLEEHGPGDYGKWYLALDDEHGRQAKGHYKFPYGDFERVHRCGVLSAESRAAQNGYADVASAAAHLHGQLEQLR
jgi:hypothetical protein